MPLLLLLDRYLLTGRAARRIMGESGSQPALPVRSLRCARKVRARIPSGPFPPSKDRLIWECTPKWQRQNMVQAHAIRAPGGGMSKKTDIWMPLVIGDYLKDTQHLDATRHGCYLLWLMHYWTKGPLPNSIEEVIWIGKLRGEHAPSIAQALLSEFFTLGSDGRWHQKRADAEKNRWHDKQQKQQDKAKKAADTRWGNGASSNAPSIPTSNAHAVHNSMLNGCPSPSPSSSPSSLPSPSPPPPGEKPRAADPAAGMARRLRRAFSTTKRKCWQRRSPTKPA